MKYNKYLSRMKLVDKLIVLALIIGALGFVVFFFRKTETISIELKVTEQDVLYANSAAPSWFANLFKPGIKTKDGLGRTIAEVTRVYSYDEVHPYNRDPSKKALYITMDVATTYNSRTGEYKFRGTTLAVGEAFRISLGNLLVQGLITDIEGLDNPYQEREVLVETVLQETYQPFAETTGVDDFIVEAINEGDQVFDSEGSPVVTVVEKRVTPAEKNTFDDRGNVYLRQDPRKNDLYLTLRVKANEINGELYFFDNLRLQINSAIPLHFENISIYPMITKII